jgi:hypothetical protein
MIGMTAAKRGVPFVGKKCCRWSIGFYEGESPLSFSPSEKISNPILTAKDVTDSLAEYVADPFMIYENSMWFMFFEVLNKETNQGDIAFASSMDAINWQYKQIILDEPFHLSYPYVFKKENNYYMIPETYQTNSIRLYRAIDFPENWEFSKTLISGKDFVDPSIFYYEDKWWLFASTTQNDTLYLYYADTLMGPWTEHPESPVVSNDKNKARPAGRVVIYDDHIIRYAQDDYPTYGNQVYAFEVIHLTTSNYEEKEVEDNPIIKAGKARWNEKGMHHIDSYQISHNKWVACVDGFGPYLVFGLKY